jgi:hypothetical protein
MDFSSHLRIFLSGLECIYIKARGISYLCGIINGSLIIFFSVENYLNEIHSQALQAAQINDSIYTVKPVY